MPATVHWVERAGPSVSSPSIVSARVRAAMSRLSLEDWSRLCDAYGPATEIPALLRSLTADDVALRDGAYEELGARLVHQGVSRFEASAHAVPFLIEWLADLGAPTGPVSSDCRARSLSGAWRLSRLQGGSCTSQRGAHHLQHPRAPLPPDHGRPAQTGPSHRLDQHHRRTNHYRRIDGLLTLRARLDDAFSADSKVGEVPVGRLPRGPDRRLLKLLGRVHQVLFGLQAGVQPGPPQLRESSAVQIGRVVRRPVRR